jgi:hypothetical protein
VRWTLQRGAIAALGTGKDASKVGSYTKEDLDVWDFALTVRTRPGRLRGLRVLHS